MAATSEPIEIEWAEVKALKRSSSAQGVTTDLVISLPTHDWPMAELSQQVGHSVRLTIHPMQASFAPADEPA